MRFNALVSRFASFALATPGPAREKVRGMRKAIRISQAAVLALILILTSQAMAVTRGTTGPAGQMVLCTDTGPTIVFIDENGAPTRPPAYCPDCALTTLSALTPPAQSLAFQYSVVSQDFPTLQPVVHGTQQGQFSRARAPPFVAI